MILSLANSDFFLTSRETRYIWDRCISLYFSSTIRDAPYPWEGYVNYFQDGGGEGIRLFWLLIRVFFFSNFGSSVLDSG